MKEDTKATIGDIVRECGLRNHCGTCPACTTEEYKESACYKLRNNVGIGSLYPEFWTDKMLSEHGFSMNDPIDNVDSQTAKADAGKLQISLVPTQIVKDIAEVRMYGNKKYGNPDNWKTVEKERYVDALLRHMLEYVKDPNSIDSESGIPHYKHMACNMAFICEMEAGGYDDMMYAENTPVIGINRYTGMAEKINVGKENQHE